MHLFMVECNPNGVAKIAMAPQLGYEVTPLTADPAFYASPLAKSASIHPRCRILNSDTAYSIDDLKIAKAVHT
jgi:hypothetical protein